MMKHSKAPWGILVDKLDGTNKENFSGTAIHLFKLFKDWNKLLDRPEFFDKYLLTIVNAADIEDAVQELYIEYYNSEHAGAEFQKYLETVLLHVELDPDFTRMT